jgi:hypothetical protein
MKRNKLFLYSLSSLAVIASSAVYAEEFASAPSLEGGFEAMIGGFLAVPSTDDTTYNTNLPESGDIAISNIDGEYKVGIQAAIGYVFPGTANAIELSWRNYDSSSSDSTSYDAMDDYYIDDKASYDVRGNQGNRYEDWDLMISQYLDIGTHVQMRLLGGISYLSELDQTTSIDSIETGYVDCIDNSSAADIVCSETYDDETDITSSFRGLGPRVGIDGRYDFGEDIAGFGIVGGFSVAYLLGNLDLNTNETETETYKIDGVIVDEGVVYISTLPNTIENHAVTNLRANLGIDYVYFFDNEELSTLGLELGYEVDTYLDGIGQSFINPVSSASQSVNTTNITFSGPYLNLKGVF